MQLKGDVRMKSLDLKEVGAYQIDAVLGRSRFEAHYRARDPLYEKIVTMKVLLPPFARNLQLAREYIRGGREAMRLQHPNIVGVEDAGHAGGYFFVVEEYVEGRPLAAQLQDKHQPLPVSEVITIVSQVAQALDYAHQRGIVHRMLEPQAILRANDGRVALSGFAMAPFVAAIARTGQMLSLPGALALHLSPEQASGAEEIDSRSDIFSLGGLAYLLLTGRPPFGGANPLAMLRKIIEEAPEPAHLVSQAVTRQASTVLAEALAKAPEERSKTAGAFARALAGGLGQPTTVEEELVISSPMVVMRGDEGVAAKQGNPSYIAPVASLVPNDDPESQLGRVTVQVGGRSIQLPARERTRRKRPSRPLMLAAGMAAVAVLLTVMVMSARALLAPAPVEIAGLGVEEVLSTPTPQPLVATSTPVVALVVEAAQPEPAVNTQEVNPPAYREAIATRAGQPRRIAVVVGTTTGAIEEENKDKIAGGTLSGTTTVPDVPLSNGENSSAGIEQAGGSAPLSIAAVTTAESVAPAEYEAVAVELATPMPAAPAQEVVASTLGGRIAFPMWNPHTDRPDVYVWEAPTQSLSAPIPNMRQPDFNLHNMLTANGVGGGVDNLVVMGPGGEGPRLVSEHPEDGRPHWSPNGEMVVFDSAHVGDRQYRIYLMAEVRRQRELPPLMYEAWELFGRYPVFITDGLIAYNGCNYWENGGTCGIYLVDTGGGEPINATGWPRDVPTDDVAGQLLFMSDRTGNWDVYIYDPASGASKQLTEHPARDGLATASPDGQHIAFVTDREGSWAVYVMQTDGSGQRKLFDLPFGFGPYEYDWFYERLSWGQ
jgi:serine/threonine protein kinase